MPHSDPDPNDPTMLVGMTVPGDLESVREMACTFAEELASLEFPTKRILKMFDTPFYAAPHRALTILGREEIEKIIQQSVAFYGSMRFIVRDGKEK